MRRIPPLAVSVLAVAAMALIVAFAPAKPRPSSVGATFTVAPDSTVNATITVTVSGTLKTGDAIRYKIVKDTTLVLNKVAAPYSYSATGLPAPAYGATSTYTPCARVVYATGSQSPEKCGTPWTHTRPDVPPAVIDSVIVTPASATVPQGGTFQFSATVYGS